MSTNRSYVESSDLLGPCYVPIGKPLPKSTPITLLQAELAAVKRGDLVDAVKAEKSERKSYQYASNAVLKAEYEALTRGDTQSIAPHRLKKLAATVEKKDVLFDDVHKFLSGVLLTPNQSSRLALEKQQVTISEDDIGVEDWVDVDIPYVPKGVPWVVDKNELRWSFEGIEVLQWWVCIESLKELACEANEREKWDVLKWVFKPAIRNHYIFDKRINRSHCLPMHELEYAFSFRNCAIAANRDPDECRSLLRARLAPEVLQALERFYSFN